MPGKEKGNGESIEVKEQQARAVKKEPSEPPSPI